MCTHKLWRFVFELPIAFVIYIHICIVDILFIIRGREWFGGADWRRVGGFAAPLQLHVALHTFRQTVIYIYILSYYYYDFFDFA